MKQEILCAVKNAACAFALFMPLSCGSLPQVLSNGSEQALAAGPINADATLLFVGDSGQGDDQQKINAHAIKEFCAGHSCQAVAYMGDNFPSGVRDINDPQFKSRFADVYHDMSIPFQIVLGNHDHLGNIQAEIDYSAKSSIWRLPARYYQFSLGPADIFVLDTTNFDNQQREWLQKGLKADAAAWKIVIGHHPVYSSGSHGDSKNLIKDLLPILQNGGVRFYLSGHDHDKEVMVRSGITFIVCGTGSAPRSVGSGASKSMFSSSKLGFCHFAMDRKQIQLTILDRDDKVEYSHDFGL